MGKDAQRGSAYIKSILILAKELAKEDGREWYELIASERNNYYAKASKLPRH